MSKRKVLLMGASGAGKTSMRSIIFANYLARDTMRLGATINVEHSNVRFLGNLVLNLWDCGGQDAFMESYFESQRESIFRNVEVLVYLLDVKSEQVEKDMRWYQSCLEALMQNSRNARVFILFHKMDLIPEAEREEVMSQKRTEIMRLSQPLRTICFGTSIWDDSLYKAWSAMVHELIPHVGDIESRLDAFCGACGADEVVLFERATFLVIASATQSEQHDEHRFEKVSNIVKQYKLSCIKAACDLQAVRLCNANVEVLIDSFTANSVVMVVWSDKSVPEAATSLNISLARKSFESLLN